MKRLLVCILIFAVVFGVLSPAASAEESVEESKQDFRWEDYSLDELLAIEEELSKTIAEKQRQYAIEHGDRRIIVKNTDLNVFISGSLTLEADVEKVLETAPENTKLLWSSSDDSIARVSSSGVVTGVSKGEAIITCCAEDNELIFAETPVQVVVPVSSVSLEKTEETILLFEEKDCGIQLSCTILPEDSFCQDVVWTSSDEKIATVDENGYVTAVAPGRATITATSQDTSSYYPRSANCRITVLQAASSLALDQESVTVDMGSYVTLTATVLPENTSNKKIEWTSSNEEVATVYNGQVRAVACGDATITTTTTDGSDIQAVCKVTVIQKVTGIRFADLSSTVTLNRGSKQTIKAEITPDYATDQSVEWTSSDPSVATVSKTGEVSAVNGGTATITCTAKDGSEKQASVNVFVPSISIDKEEYTVTEKDGLDFTLKFYGKSEDFEVYPSSNGYFNATFKIESNTVTVHISPLVAGSSSITLRDRADSKNDRTVRINIEHSAVYDSSSYPTLDYTAAMRNPDSYSGKPCCVYGKVLQIMKQTHWFRDDDYVARIGTGGWGYYDNVYYVTIPVSAMDVNIIEDDMVTIYGICTGTETYSALLGNSITIPAVTAEKVVLS